MNPIKFFSRLLTVFGLLFLTACITAPSGAHRDYPYGHIPEDQRSAGVEPAPQQLPYPQPVPNDPSDQYEPPQTQPAPVPARPQAGAAVVSLMQVADERYDDGDLVGAGASIERALRIEPRNPELWYKLAAVRLEQQRYEQAESLAQKSVALSGPYARIRAASWGLIAESRRQRGDARAAAEADAEARAAEQSI